MTLKDKELLLKDLYGRLPYGVKILHGGWNYEWDDELFTVERVVGIDERFIYTKIIDSHTGEEYKDDRHTIQMFDDKLFLRPMSSMTEEERNEYIKFRYVKHHEWDGYSTYTEYVEVEEINNYFDWLNTHYFDYRGLIPMGLALDAPDGMYNTKTE